MEAFLGLYNRPDIVEAILHQYRRTDVPKCSLCGRGKINLVSVNFTSEETSKTHNVELANPRICPLCGKEL